MKMLTHLNFFNDNKNRMTISYVVSLNFNYQYKYFLLRVSFISSYEIVTTFSIIEPKILNYYNFEIVTTMFITFYNYYSERNWNLK